MDPYIFEPFRILLQILVCFFVNHDFRNRFCLNFRLSVLYNSPIIYSHSMFTQWSVLKRIDEASNPAYTVDNLSKNVPPLTFAQRLEELWYQIKGKYVKE